jgi:hypothetical protein
VDKATEQKVNFFTKTKTPMVNLASQAGNELCKLLLCTVCSCVGLYVCVCVCM